MNLNIKVSIKKKQIKAKLKLNRNEEINVQDMRLLNTKIVRGLMIPKALDPHTIELSSQGDMFLKDFFKRKVGKDEVFLIVAQVIETIKAVVSQGLNVNNLVLDLDYIFIDGNTFALSFVYQPIIGNKVLPNIPAFVLDVIQKAKPKDAEDAAYLRDFTTFITTEQRISAFAIGDYIRYKCPHIYKVLNNAPAAQQSAPQTVYAEAPSVNAETTLIDNTAGEAPAGNIREIYINEPAAPIAPEQTYYGEDTGLLADDGGYEAPAENIREIYINEPVAPIAPEQTYYGEDTGLLTDDGGYEAPAENIAAPYYSEPAAAVAPEQTYYGEDTGLLTDDGGYEAPAENIADPYYSEPAAAVAPEQTYYEEDTGLLTDDDDYEAPAENIAAPYYNAPAAPVAPPANAYYNRNQPAPAPAPAQPVNTYGNYNQQRDVQQSFSYGEGTGVLPNNEGTTLFGETTIDYPYLIRLSTFDRIEINKPIFKIGKEKSFVDCCISNNNAVSRMHADIITQGLNYYIRDNNSTNRTFVNGVVITPDRDFQIFDGDHIMMANEAFEFHIR